MIEFSCAGTNHNILVLNDAIKNGGKEQDYESYTEGKNDKVFGHSWTLAYCLCLALWRDGGEGF